jgi:NAD(P)-dependent dehydrogenase (short-subunit alcohol dehydrogenase family)
MAGSPFDLSGKTALVTGAARGIGEAISQVFAEHGARVMASDVDGPEAARAAAALKQGHPGCRSVRLDVTEEASVQRAVAETLREFGQIDILVNNAGINTVRDRVTIEKYSLEDWRQIIEVDLNGVFLVSRPVVEQMKAIGGGRIINISSVLGLVPARLQSAFVAAKAAVINLTRSMALELAPQGILVNALAPGSTLTEGTKKLFYGPDGAYSEKMQSLLSHIPLGRPGLPEEIAMAALFFAAPASSYITGAVLPVDGGWTAGYLRDW